MEKNNKYRYKDLTKNTLLFAISSFGTKLLTFLLVPLYTNILSTVDYGTADLLYTTTTLLVVVFTINISEGVLIFAMDRKYTPREVLYFGIKVILIGWWIITIALSIGSMIGIFTWPTYYYVFVSVFFISSALYQTLSNYLRAVNQVKEVAIAGIISSIVYCLCNIIFLLIIKLGLNGYLISTIMGPFAGIIYCTFVGQISVKGIVKEHLSNIQCKTIIKYCLPLVFNSIALWVNGCLDRYFVTYFCGVEENGIYSVASKIPVVLSTIYTIFSQAWTLSAVKEFDPEDKDGFFTKTYEAYNAVMAISCSALILMNVPLARILYAKDFFIAWKCSSILTYGIFFNALTAFIGSIFAATKNSTILASTTIVSAIINTILNIVLIPRFGAEGAAVATVIALALMWMIRMIEMRKLIRIKINWIKEAIVFIVLCLQIIAEHLKNHMYIIQIVLFIIILILMIKPFITILKKRFNQKK